MIQRSFLREGGMTGSFDIVVIGGGPAGLAATGALCERGLEVATVAPSHRAPWPNCYGVWVDELEPLGLGECFERIFREPTVRSTREQLEALSCAYGRVDNARLRERLRSRAERGSVRWVEAVAAGIEHTAKESIVVCRGGERLNARLVIDASGHRPVFVQREHDRCPAYQSAFGVVSEVEGEPLGGASMTLMDYASDDGADAEATPSFLYAMRLDRNRWFLEETVLASASPVDSRVLKQRLHRRMARRGVTLGAYEAVEHVRIPMGLALPVADQRVVGWGGAASLVHPATGYMLARALCGAEALADVVAEGFDRSTPEELAARAWRAVWPVDAVRSRHLSLVALEALLDFDAARTRQFFSTFFALPSATWRDFMTPTHDTARLARIMLRLFTNVSPGIKASMARVALLPSREHLLRGLGLRGARPIGREVAR